MPSKLFAAAAVGVVMLAVAVPSAQARSPNVAALQVALRAFHHYNGAIDGI